MKPIIMTRVKQTRPVIDCWPTVILSSEVLILPDGWVLVKICNHFTD